MNATISWCENLGQKIQNTIGIKPKTMIWIIFADLGTSGIHFYEKVKSVYPISEKSALLGNRWELSLLQTDRWSKKI